MKRTHEEFINMSYNLYGDEFEIIGTYVNKRTKIKIKHIKCEKEHDVYPSYFLKGEFECPICRINPRLKTQEQFLQEVYELVGNEYTVIGSYKNAIKKIEIKHEKCGYSWKVLPNGFLGGYRCPNCAGNARKNTAVFKNEVFNLVGEEYTVLGEYSSAHKKIKLKHNNESCNNYEFEISPASFLSGHRCVKCAKNKKRTTEEFKREVYQLVSDEYSVLGEYVNSITKIKMKHNLCGYEYEVTPSNFISQNARCSPCAYKNNASKLKKSQEEFENIVFDLVGEEYTVLGEYKNARTKIKMKHNVCDSEYEILPTNFTDLNRRCPICNESKGEKRIRKWLVNNQIEFIPQKQFKGLIGLGGGNLSYDFYLIKENILIEYQGEFHDGKVNEYVKENLEYQQEHDRRKREYALNHNIELLEIWYWDYDNIENILLHKLIK